MTLENLFEDSLQSSRAGLASWYVLPKSVDAPLALYLQRRVRFFALQFDNDTHTPEGDEQLGQESAGLAKQLEAAILLGNADFLSKPGLQRPIPDDGDPVLSLIASLIDKAPLFLKDDSGERFEIHLSEKLQTVPRPLSIVILKHVADLCADFDRWDAALRLYSSASKQLQKSPNKAFRELLLPLRDATLQSRACATRIVNGAGEAFAVLSVATQSSSLNR